MQFACALRILAPVSIKLVVILAIGESNGIASSMTREEVSFSLVYSTPCLAHHRTSLMTFLIVMVNPWGMFRCLDIQVAVVVIGRRVGDGVTGVRVTIGTTVCDVWASVERSMGISCLAW